MYQQNPTSAENPHREYINLLVRVAQMYYDQGETQQEIADKLGLNRTRIGQLLKEARTEGIVQIRIVDPYHDYHKVGEVLRMLYDLKQVVIVPEPLESRVSLRRNLGKATAELLHGLVVDDTTVGIGWGLTVMETINQLIPSQRRNVRVVPLIGGSAQSSPEFSVNELAMRFAMAFGGTCIPFHVPVLVDNEETFDALCKESHVRQITETWDQVDLAVVGIGAAASHWPSLLNTHLGTGSLNFDEIGAVGDICGRLLDAHGNLCDVGLEKRMLGIDFERLRRIPTVIATAGGLQKADGIKAALQAGLIDILVTDEAVAQRIIETSFKRDSFRDRITAD